MPLFSKSGVKIAWGIAIAADTRHDETKKECVLERRWAMEEEYIVPDST
ncbi:MULTISPECIES: hypothetical protein [unclassified Corynebacterium]|nr:MULTISPECIES: hypothetical protein [unclassified Corynebacterium]